MPLPIVFSIALGCGMMEQQEKDGTRLFLFAPGEAVSVSVDGNPATELSTFAALGVGPGEHSVSVNGGEAIKVTLEPFQEVVVPVVPGQCFMSLDVSTSDYGSGSQGVPVIAGRLQESAPFDLPKDTYGSKNELPSSISSGQRVFLLRSAQCYAIDDLQFGLKGQVTRPDGSSDAVAGGLAQLRRALCAQDEAPSRSCQALREWVSASESPLPTAPAAFLGLSWSLPAGAGEETLAEPTVSVLALDPSGRTPNASLTGLTPDSPQEKAELDAAKAAADAWLQGSGEGIPVGPGLGGWLDGWGAQASTALEPKGAGWDAGGTELRKVGQGWVSVGPLAEGKGMEIALYGPYAKGE